MSRFEERLAALIGVALLGACSGDDGGTDTGTPLDLAAVCEGATPPEDYQLALGFVEIEPGGTCPDAADAQLQVHGCTFLEWQDITCAFDRVDTDQVFVDDGYGGFYADEGSVTTGYYTVGPVVDVCYYEGVFYLDPNHPTCGRPLLRDGEAVVAEVQQRPSGWAEAPEPRVAHLTPGERARIAAHWLESAALEHASVASFACFTLDLMRFGAPPELLRASQKASLDEIEHARLCFALASGFAGRELAPGALAVPAGAAGRSRVEVVEALVREGCIGETLAAVDAAARLAGATDPAVRAALEVIVRDESEHAALAWRALRWFLEQDPTLAETLERVFDEERTRWTAAASADAGVSEAAAGAGALSAKTRARALARAWETVIDPALADLAWAGR